MDLRPGRPLGSLPTPVPRRSGRPPGFPDGDGSDSDRISALPDEMLLQILVRLRCARAAAHTSGLSRRWRGLWRHLPELSFRGMSADAIDAALDQVASPALSLLEVDVPHKHRVMDPARVSALFRAAARLAPADLVFSLWGGSPSCKDLQIPIEIPCFERATSVRLNVRNLYLVPPAGGVELPLLERLSVAGCRLDIEELVLRCPRLRVLELSLWGYGTTVVKVHSSTIEELSVESILSNIDIMAPVLKRFSLWVSTDDQDFTVSFSAPMVENISWYCLPMVENAGFGEIWRLCDLNLEMKENVGVLQMSISACFPDWTPPAVRSFSQEIERLPAFSVLELRLLTKNHGIGALVWHLLGICSTIKSLKVDRHIWGEEEEETCSPNCPCDQPQTWRNEIISLTALEEVEVRGFQGTENEVDFLKLLFRCAPLMKSMTVVLAPESLPTDEDCEEICSIFEANPHAKCSVYRRASKD